MHVLIKHCSDWVRVELKTETETKVIHEGHSIKPHDLLYILSNFTQVLEIEVSDEEMEQC
jgi:hypothetical protein